MKLYYPRAQRYAVEMSHASPLPLIARLRASARLTIWVLALFLMKVGMVAACTVHDIKDSRLNVETAISQSVELPVAQDADTRTEPSTPWDAGASCPDCGCHHAAALLPATPLLTAMPLTVRAAAPPASIVPAPPSLELRPPIV